jgi:hypothetical protein
MNKPIYADFNNADEEGRVRLNTEGTVTDLEEHSVSLSAGQRLKISDGEMETEGVVEFSDDEQIWVIRIDREKISET